jgi:hypothetical protein
MTATVTVIELADSRTWTWNQPGNESSVVCTYLASWLPNDPADVYPGDQIILGDTNMPKPSRRPPTAVHANDTSLKELVCRSVNMVPARERPYTWRVQATYSNPEMVDAAMGVFARQTRTSGSRLMETYRTWTTLPTDGSPSYPPSDIGGTKLDWNGNPRQREVAQQTIQLEYFWDRTTSGSDTATEPAFSTFITNQGKRNTDVLFGCPKGSLLYRGCQATLENEVWRLVHVWVFDNLYHLVQLPVPNATGAPILTAGITIAGQQILQVTSVGWYQMYTDFVDFSTVLPADIYGELTKARPQKV